MAREGHSDRLSSLPDVVLVEILSLLKARQVIQTCVLSKRWLKLWASVPCLKFNISEFRNEETRGISDISELKNEDTVGNSDVSELKNEETVENSDISESENEETVENPDFSGSENEATVENSDVSEFKKEAARGNWGRDLERFENFISKFLLLHDNAIDLDKLHVKCHVRSEFGTMNSAYVRTWILYASKHNVKSLKMSFTLHEPIDLPDCLFVCETLVNLDLSFSFLNDLSVKIKPVRISLPRLKRVEFRRAILNGNCMEKILFGCPALEFLIMTYCNLKTSNISSERLNRLMFDGCSLISKKTVPTVFTICAPNVEYLHFDVYSEHENMKVAFEGMSNVPEAWIAIDFHENNYSHVLSGLPGLEKLDIRCECFMQMLEAELPKLPKFNNLKNLSLGNCCMLCAFGLLASFLNHCPNLENLCLRHYDSYCQNNGGHGLEENNQNSLQIERFCCERLKIVELTKEESTDFLIKHLSQSTKETVEFSFEIE